MTTHMLDSLFEARDSADAEFEAYATPLLRESRDLTEDETKRVEELRSGRARIDARILEIEEDLKRAELVQEARTRLGTAAVDANVSNVHEPRTYGKDSPNSYVADFCRATQPGIFGGDVQGAVDRLNRYAAEVAGEMRDSNSAEGKRAARSLRVQNRDHDAGREAVDRARNYTYEARAGMSTGSTSGGSFVTPQYFVADYAPYRQFNRVFADAANKLPLPDYGMTIYLPAVNTAAAVAAQAGENQGITEQDPNAGYLSSGLVTNAGQITVSQQLLDRAGPNFSFDVMCFDQLQRAYNATLDTYVLTQALANAGSVTYSSGGTYITSTGALYPSIGKAKAATVDAAGVVLPATHAFFQPINWEWYASQADSAGRLLVVPSYANPFNAAAAGGGTPMAEGDTGYRIHGLPVFEDGNIPATGGTNQIVVAHMPEVWFWEGDLVNRTVPQTAAQNLSVLLQSYSYCAAIVRYQKAVQTINGSGVPLAPTF